MTQYVAVIYRDHGTKIPHRVVKILGVFLDPEVAGTKAVQWIEKNRSGEVDIHDWTIEVLTEE